MKNVRGKTPIFLEFGGMPSLARWLFVHFADSTKKCTQHSCYLNENLL